MPRGHAAGAAGRCRPPVDSIRRGIGVRLADQVVPATEEEVDEGEGGDAGKEDDLKDLEGNGTK